MNNKKNEGTVGKYGFGTAVFVSRLPGKIVVAADSRKVDGEGTIQSDEVCKIRKFGSGYLVVNGAVGDSESKYDFFRLMSETSNENVSLSVNVNTLATAVLPLLTEEANRLKNENAESFHRNMIETDPLGFCVVGIENGIPVLIAKNFSVVDEFADEIALKVKTAYFPQVGIEKGLYLVGSEEINNKLNKKYPGLQDSPKKPVTVSLHKIARQYIQDMIDSGVNKVGGPIDILSITAKEGFVWVQKKENCDE